MPIRHLTVTATGWLALIASNAIGNELRLSHQASAEAAFLDPIGRTTDIEIDFVISEVGTDLGGLGEFDGIGTAKLQRDRVLVFGEADEMLAVTANDGVRRNHLGIKQSLFRQPTMERPAMPVRPVHHWRNTEAMA